MNTIILTETWPARIHTKIVGTTFEGRQEVLAWCRDRQVTRLTLTPEPENRYDEHAIAVEANIGPRIVKLGYLSNSDRLCSDCGLLVGGALFEKSRRLRCTECGQEFGYDSPVITGRDGVPIIECPGCGSSVDLGLAKIVECPNCGGTEFGRGGLATRISRAMAAGVRYEAHVTEFTGGDVITDGKRKTLGCNIRISRIDD